MYYAKDFVTRMDTTDKNTNKRCRSFKKGQKVALRATKANSKSITVYELANFHVKTVFDVAL